MELYTYLIQKLWIFFLSNEVFLLVNNNIENFVSTKFTAVRYLYTFFSVCESLRLRIMIILPEFNITFTYSGFQRFSDLNSTKASSNWRIHNICTS